MKMLKKTLALLLAATIAMCISGTFAFAEITTERTAFPSAPANADCYVHMQVASSVKTGTYTICAADGSTTTSSSAASWSKPRSFAKGFFVNTRGYGIAISGIDAFGEEQGFCIRPGSSYSKTTSPLESEKNAGMNIALANADNTASTYVDSDNLMINTKKVYIERPGDSDKYYGFGLATQSDYSVAQNALIEAWAWVGMSGADTGLQLYAQDYDSTEGKTKTQKFDLSDFVQPEQIFDMKLLVDLDAKTYNVYIDNKPVATELTFDNNTVKSIALVFRGESESVSNTVMNPTTAVSITECYAMTDDEAAQYKQAALESAFAREDAGAKNTLFYTREGSADYNKLCGTDATAYRSFKCADSNFAIASETVGETSYKKVYYTADANYDYDNLEYVYVSAPEEEAATAKVTGTYELIGGKGLGCKPVVIQALYEDTDKTELKELAVQEATAAYGTYGGTAFEPTAQLDKARAAAFIWGGKSKLVPLFGRVDFE